MFDQTHFRTVIINVFNGFLASLLYLFCFWSVARIREFLKNRKFKNLFGPDTKKNFTIVYGRMSLKPVFDKNGDPIQSPYIKRERKIELNFSAPVSFSDTKSAIYLSECFGEIGIYPKLVSDYDIEDKLNFSYCSLGSYNNFKTIDILESAENIFFEIDWAKCEIKLKDDKRKKFRSGKNFDYAVIIKIIPTSFKNRVWIAVAGLGEWGTSGAAWFLSKNWKEIERIARNKQFGLIVKVNNGKDESAEIVYKKVKEC